MNVQLRLDSVSDEDLRSRNPIYGLFVRFDQREPTFTTRDAVTEDILPLCLTNQLSINAGELMTVLQSCETEAARRIARGGLSQGLSHSYVAMLYLYTAQFYAASSFYAELNRILRDENREAVKPLRRVIWILMWALNYCPAYSGRLLYRGVKQSMAANYTVDTEFTWHQFSSCSCTVSAQEDENFTGSQGDRTLFNIELTTNRARVISECSWFINEKEALLPANSCFRVISNADLGNGLTQIQLQEIEPVDPILVFHDFIPNRPAPSVPTTAADAVVAGTNSQLYSLCVDEVQLLLDALRYPNLKPRFLEHNIDGKTLAYITSIDDFNGLNIPTLFITPFVAWLRNLHKSPVPDPIVTGVRSEYENRIAERDRIEAERAEREPLCARSR